MFCGKLICYNRKSGAIIVIILFLHTRLAFKFLCPATSHEQRNTVPLFHWVYSSKSWTTKIDTQNSKTSRNNHTNQTWYIIQTVQTSRFHPRLIDSIDVVKRRKAGLYGICFCTLQWWPGSLGWCGCRRRRTWNAAGYTRGGAAGGAASLCGTAAGTSTLWGSFMRNHGNHVIGKIQMCIFTAREYLRMMFAWIF